MGYLLPHTGENSSSGAVRLCPISGKRPTVQVTRGVLFTVLCFLVSLLRNCYEIIHKEVCYA